MLCFTQDVSKPAKRKQSESLIDTSVSLIPRKKPRTEPPAPPAPPAEDGPRQSRFRLKPQAQTPTSAVRMSPRKTSQPPAAPGRAESRQETPKRSSKGRQTSEDDAQRFKGSERDADVLHAAETCSRTQVIEMQLPLSKIISG